MLLLVLVFVVALVMVHFQPTATALLSLLLGAVWVWAGLQLFTRAHLFVRIAPPLMGMVIAYLTAALVTERRARHLRRHFRRYVGREVADQIAEMDDDEIGRMGKERLVTILFSDMRGYSQFTSALPPEAIMDFLNRYFARMTAAVLAHHGFVNQYTGDGLMAIFGMFPVGNGTASVPYNGAPVGNGRRAVPDGAQSALDAARAALAMRRAIEGLRKKDKDFKDISIGIGLHTGKVVIGEVGTPDKSDFTAVGSPVNMASRISDESRRIFYERVAQTVSLRPTQRNLTDCATSVIILMSHVTHDLVKDVVEAHFLGAVTIRGWEEEVRLWELMGESLSTND